LIAELINVDINMKLPKWMNLRKPSTGNGPAAQDAIAEPSKSALAGIGVIFSIGPDKGFYIKSMMPGSAAHDCGILCEGDCLIAVDGKEVNGKSPESVTNKILGKVGT
jgi:C-terminal processing protease CtpA/Prc